MSNSLSLKQFERLLARAQSPGVDPALDAAIRGRRDKDEIRERCRTLAGFVYEAWDVLEYGKPLAWGWALDAMCEHLEAISQGQIARLLINCPPGMMKSLLVGVFWPAWEWANHMAHLRILGASYKEEFAVRDARRMRELITSPWFQSLWGHQVSIVRGGEGDFSNNQGGWRKGYSLVSLTGERGDRVVIDDPLSAEMAESERERERARRAFTESVPTRLISPKDSAIVVIMQRLHDQDISGIILKEGLGYDHLCLPMRYEPGRSRSTSIGFVDPRRREGELLFPERWDAKRWTGPRRR